MKKQFCILLFLLYCTLVKSQDCFGNYYLDGGFCTTTISLWSDSTFFWESGCEGNSNIQTGCFSIRQNEIEFKTIEKDSFNVIFDIAWVDSRNRIAEAIQDSTMSYFYVVDRNDKLIKGLEIVCYDDLDTYQSLKDDYEGSYYFYSDDIEELYIPALSIFLKQFISIKVPEKPEDKSVLKITLNIASSLLFYPMIKYHHVREIISGVYKEDKLIIGKGDDLIVLDKVKK